MSDTVCTAPLRPKCKNIIQLPPSRPETTTMMVHTPHIKIWATTSTKAEQRLSNIEIKKVFRFGERLFIFSQNISAGVTDPGLRTVNAKKGAKALMLKIYQQVGTSLISHLFEINYPLLSTTVSYLIFLL